jgi:hypothetical protein
LSARARALLARGWGRATVAALALSVLLLLSGALAAVFYRPYGHDVRPLLAHGDPAPRVAVASALQMIHLAGALALGASLLALVVLARPWRRTEPAVAPRRLAWLVLLAAALLGTGLVAPWERLLPWSPAVGANMARPMPLGQQGPFAELVGVNAHYDEAMFTFARRRFGVKAVGRVYFTHVLVLPALAGLLLFRIARRKRA